MQQTIFQNDLLALFNELLKMPVMKKRQILATFGAPKLESSWTKAEKTKTLQTMENGLILGGVAGQIAGTMTTTAQRFLVLDILRTLSPVFRLSDIARLFGISQKKALEIEAMGKARYLAFTSSAKALQRINCILEAIQEQAEGKPAGQTVWKAIAIGKIQEASFCRC